LEVDANYLVGHLVTGLITKVPSLLLG